VSYVGLDFKGGKETLEMHFTCEQIVSVYAFQNWANALGRERVNLLGGHGCTWRVNVDFEHFKALLYFNPNYEGACAVGYLEKKAPERRVLQLVRIQVRTNDLQL
jgi:hypothetical protein